MCRVGTQAELGFGGVLLLWGCVSPGASVRGLRVTGHGAGCVTVPLLWHRLQDEVTLRLEAESNLAAYRQVRAGARSCIPHPAPQGLSSQPGLPGEWAGMG